MSFSSGPVVSRRTFCLCCVASTAFSATGGWLSPSQVFATSRNIVEMIRESAATAQISVHRLRRDVSILEGSGGNVAVLTGRDGKLMVDAGITASKPRMLEAIGSLGKEPVRHLVNTHWHFDHTDGNEWLHGEGAAIMAHANTRKHLLEAQRVEDWDYNFPPSSEGAVPTEVFAGDKTLSVNCATVALKHHASAHTDSDISVQFREADIVHTGGIYWNGIYPFIDYSTGGSIDGTISAASAILSASTANTIVIPGHGQPISNPSELQAYRDMLVQIRANVAALKKKGMSVEDVVKAKPTSGFDDKWGKFVIGPAFFAKLVYEGV